MGLDPKRDAALEMLAQEALEKLAKEARWRVSTAVIVDGILRLYSSNPKRDANLMRKDEASPRSELRNGPKDNTPLRDVFIDGNDALIYKMVLNYLRASEDIFWSEAGKESFIFRTIGVQAIFDILRKIAARSLDESDIRVEYFSKILGEARGIDFSADRFRNPSGSGRTVIRRAIEEAIGIA
jgi:hypothetical protein